MNGEQMSTTITVDVSEAVKKLDPADLGKAINEGIEKSLDPLWIDMRIYPPPPPRSRYIRTGNLGRSWAKIRTSPWQGIVGSRGVRYAPYVQDDTHQAPIHQGRWQTTKSVAIKRTADVKRFIEEAIIRWIK